MSPPYVRLHDTQDEADVAAPNKSQNQRAARSSRMLRLSLISNILLASACLLLLIADRVEITETCRRQRGFEAVYDDMASLTGCTPVRFDTDPVDRRQDFKVYWGRHWFEGSDDEIDALWRNVTDIQLVAISTEEAARLPASTARNADSPDSFAVVPQVFHDIHCLNYIRNHALGRPQIHNGESAPERVIHVEHCLGILRQNLMCEANLQPIIFSTVDGVPQSNPGATPRQCRNWDVLWPWALRRNITSGSVLSVGL